MKRVSILLLTFLISFHSFGQDITGQWNGVLKVQGTQLRLVFHVAKTDIGYKGELKENEIKGTFKQGGQEFPMNLSRKDIEKVVINRPQEPIKPYPY